MSCASSWTVRLRFVPMDGGSREYHFPKILGRIRSLMNCLHFSNAIEMKGSSKYRCCTNKSSVFQTTKSQYWASLNFSWTWTWKKCAWYTASKISPLFSRRKNLNSLTLSWIVLTRQKYGHLISSTPHPQHLHFMMQSGDANHQGIGSMYDELTLWHCKV